jgi:catalase
MKLLSLPLMAAVWLLAGAASATDAAPAATLPPETELLHQSPADMVAALHSAFGAHHSRAVHAKGIILLGEFTPDSSAQALSTAPIFASKVKLPVTLRFSDFTGIPDIPDTVGDANPRGLAIKIVAPNDEAFDVVTHSFNGFPTATSDEFGALLRSIGASGADAPHPNAVEKFLSTHPVAKNFLTTQKPPPVSYATAAYFGVNALKFTNAAGKASFVRYRFVPRAGEHYLTPAELSTQGNDYLLREIAARIAQGPVSFDWFAQIAAPGDAIDNPSIAWPDSRRLVKLGTINVSRLASDAETDQRTMFLPGTPHSGIEAADPMLLLRTQAYPISFAERQ